MNYKELQQKTFLLLLIVVTLAFGWILWPFYGAVFWSAVLAILFTPLYRRMLVAMGQRRNLAALATLLLCLIVVIFPLTMITASLIQEGATVYQNIRSGQLDFGAYFQQVIKALPSWVVNLLDRFGLSSIPLLEEKLSAGAVQGSQIVAKQAI